MLSFHMTRRAFTFGGLAISSAPLLGMHTADGTTVTVERLAWAGIRFEASGVELFVDATASPPVSGPMPPLQARGSRVFALATHHHPDHCDMSALPALLGERGMLTVHEDTARLLAARNLRIQLARFHEPLLLSRGGGEFTVRCVPMADGLGSPQAGWVIDGGGRRFIHCGDTAWHGGWWDIARAYGPFDIAFLPINGFRQTGGRFGEVTEPMSLTPEQAARAARILAARRIVPIHYGAAPDENYIEEPDALNRLRATARSLSIEAHVMVPGEEMSL